MQFTEMDAKPVRSMNTSYLENLPIDIIYEILGYLPVEMVIRVRRVCRALLRATLQKSVWGKVYKRSELLLPIGPFPSHSAHQLESCLVRAAKLHINWTSPKPRPTEHTRFPRALPSYDFDASVISGRYLQVADSYGISWYDLDSNDRNKAVMNYPCLNMHPSGGFLNYADNANGDAGVVWISFLTHSPRKICILKARFDKSKPQLDLHAEIEGQNVMAIQMAHDWLLPISEFGALSNGLMDLFHIPSRTLIQFPIHEKVQSLLDLSNMKYVITPRLLFLMFSFCNETLVDVYPLPIITGAKALVTPKSLVRSHSGIYPHAISKISFIETSYGDLPSCRAGLQSASGVVYTTFLALVYLNRSPTTWTSKIGLHIIDATVDPVGRLLFITRCQTTLNVGILTTSISFSARAGTCMAVTHSSPGPVIVAHSIHRHRNSKYTMSAKPLKCPEGLQSRQLLSFDGYTGRLCLINGWTHIDILEFA